MRFFFLMLYQSLFLYKPDQLSRFANKQYPDLHGTIVSTILCKFDKGANWVAPFLSDLISNSTPFLTI
jgi:hypothetical protein